MLLLGLNAAVENDVGTRKTHHDNLEDDHDHDDFDTFYLGGDSTNLHSKQEFTTRPYKNHLALKKIWLGLKQKIARLKNEAGFEEINQASAQNTGVRR